MRSGFTLSQIIVTITVLALLTGAAAPRFVRYRDRLNVHAATLDIVSALARTRSVAFERSTRAATTFDAPTATLAVHSYGDTLEVRQLGALYGVTLGVSRDSVTYAANAMGFGVSNTRIIVSRGAVAETVTVSRLGRVKR
jgi:type II secretory pathway pseudopilin PulG